MLARQINRPPKPQTDHIVPTGNAGQYNRDNPGSDIPMMICQSELVEMRQRLQQADLKDKQETQPAPSFYPSPNILDDLINLVVSVLVEHLDGLVVPSEHAVCHVSFAHEPPQVPA